MNDARPSANVSVLITDAWVRSSYAALRNLTNHGIQVSVADRRRLGMCQASRRKAKFVRYRSHYEDELGFVSDVAAICRDQLIELVLPSHNETEILAKYRSLLPNGADALLPDVAQCALFNNKSQAYEFAVKCGVPVPQRFAYKTLADLRAELADRPSQPYVVKLLTSNSAKGVFYADSAREVLTTVERLIKIFDLQEDRFPQVEEKVVGEGWGCSTLYWQGKPVSFFTHRRLREKIVTGGTSTLREAVVSPAIQKAAKRIFDAIGWHGLAMSEWKVCLETGRIWFVEVNPRMWGSIPLAITAGVEFPYLAWLCATQGVEVAKQYQATQTVRLGWRARWLLGDLTVGVKQLFSGKLSEAHQTLRASANSTDDFFWDDPLVFFGELGAYVANSVRSRSLNPSEKGMIG